MTIRTPYAEATAEDLNVGDRHPRATITGKFPALNNVQAGRWARGKLLHINRQCEGVTLQTKVNPGITAMMRVDFTGGTDATGEWLVESASHDLINKKTVVKLHRSIYSIQ